jgi:hypothetical protein
MLTQRASIIAAAAAGGLLLAWIITRSAAGAAKDIAQGAVGMAEGTITGVVVGIGGTVGIPETSADQCSADLAAGRTWDASFSCPAGTFVKSFFD